jgi:DNA polymerase-3 subunit alpha
VLSFFDVMPETDGDAGAGGGFDDRLPIPDLEFDKADRLRFEKEMCGLYVSDHPLIGAERALRKYVECSISDLRELDDGAMKTVAGVVTSLQRKYTKRGDLMATFVLEDLGAAIETMVFPKTMQQYGELLAPDAIVTVKARVDGRDDTPKLIAMEVGRPEVILDGGPPLRLKVRAGVLTQDKIGSLREVLSRHPGDSPVFVHLVSSEKTTVVRLGDDFLCNASNGLCGELRLLFGTDCIA